MAELMTSLVLSWITISVLSWITASVPTTFAQTTTSKQVVHSTSVSTGEDRQEGLVLKIGVISFANVNVGAVQMAVDQARKDGLLMNVTVR